MRRSKAQIERACSSKVRYGTSKKVEQAAQRVFERTGKEMTFYPCLRCKGWHLTSRTGPGDGEAT